MRWLFASLLAFHFLGCSPEASNTNKRNSSESEQVVTSPTVGQGSVDAAVVSDETAAAGATEQEKAYFTAVTVDGKSTSINLTLMSRCSVCHAGVGQGGVVYDVANSASDLKTLEAHALNLKASPLVSTFMSGGHMPMDPPFTDGEKQAVAKWLTLYVDPADVTTSDPKPTCSVTASPNVIHVGESLDLSINVVGIASDVTLQGESVDDHHPITVSPVVSTTYIVKATGPSGSGTCSVDIAVAAPAIDPPSCSLTPSTGTVAAGAPVTLVLAVTGSASSATVNGTPLNLASPSLMVSPNSTSNYAALVVGPGGTGQCHADVNVTVPAGAPTCTLSANVTSIALGAAANLQLTPTGTVTAASINGQGISAAGGIISVSPATTTNFSGSVTGPGGSSACNVTITVVSPAASCTLTASPATVVAGDAVTLNLTTLHASSATLNGIAVAAGGATSMVTPIVPSTYWYGGANFNVGAVVNFTATAVAAGGSGNCSTSVTIAPINQLTQRQAWRAKLGPSGESVDSMIANPNTCMMCHKTGALPSAVQPICPVSSGAPNVVLNASAAPAIYVLVPNNPDANAQTFAAAIHSPQNGHDYTLNVPVGTVGKVGQATDLHNYLTVKTSSACPVPSGTLQHKFAYFGGFTAAEKAYMQLWIGRYPN